MKRISIYSTKNPIEIYQGVLDGTYKRFPTNFWNEDLQFENSIIIMKYLIYEILKFNDEDIKNNISKKFFKKYKLSGMLGICFNDSPILAINTLENNRFKPWEFKNCPNNYWNETTGILALKWLFEEQLTLTDDEIRLNLNNNLFINNGLGNMLHTVYNGSPYKAINTLYNGKFNEFEFKTTPMNYWNRENALLAMDWLIIEKLNLQFSDIKKKVTYKQISKYGLRGMVKAVYNNKHSNCIADYINYHKLKTDI